jgi:hypothetical protein
MHFRWNRWEEGHRNSRIVLRNSELAPFMGVEQSLQDWLCREGVEV